MDKKQRRIALIGVVILAVAVLLIALYFGRGSDTAQDEVTATPVLAVVMTRARLSTLPRRISAIGNIAPWQEASLGTEAEGLQLTEVKVNVGDRVRRGQVLAVFKSEMVAADLAEAKASVAQAQAQLMGAEANAQRARGLDTSGAMSAQQVNEYVVAARTARARLDAAKAAAVVVDATCRLRCQRRSAGHVSRLGNPHSRCGMERGSGSFKLTTNLCPLCP